MLRDRVLNHPSTVGIYLQSTVEGIAAGHLSTWQAPSGSSEQLAADGVVLVRRREPNQGLSPAVTDQFIARFPIYQIGDCANPRKLQDALLDGATVAVSF